METPKMPLRICAQVSDVPGGRSRVRPGARGAPRPGSLLPAASPATRRSPGGPPVLLESPVLLEPPKTCTANRRLRQHSVRAAAPGALVVASDELAQAGPGHQDKRARDRGGLRTGVAPAPLWLLSRARVRAEILSWNWCPSEAKGWKSPFPLRRYSPSGPGPRGFF